MSFEQKHAAQLNTITQYYDTAQKYYELLWYFGRGYGLHYGLWTPDVHNRIHAIVKENEVLADIAQVKAGDMVLDAGCGVAGSGIWLAKNRGAKITELNIVESQLIKGTKIAARNSVDESLYFTRADYHRLPFADESFDVFWSLESIEHSDSVSTFVEEAYRVLKPGGRAVIAGTFKGSVLPTSKQETQLQVGLRAAAAFTDFHSADEIAQFMRKSGFIEVQNEDVTGLVMNSAREMKVMSQLGLPGAKLGHKMGIISQIMVDNTAWGTYQYDLFRQSVTSYNILCAVK